MNYREQVRALFRETPRAGVFSPEEEAALRTAGGRLLCGRRGSREQGAEVAFSLAVDGDGTIVEARFAAFGCPHFIAAASLSAQRLAGRVLAEAAVDPRALAAELEAPAWKLGRLLVVEDAVNACLTRDGCAPRVLS